MDRLLKAGEVAARSGLARSTLFALAKRGEIPHVRLGGIVRFPESEVERWLAEQVRRPVTAGVEGR